MLARELSEYKGHGKTVVLALPRGGVLVGFEVAKMLHVPLDIFIVRKLGLPGHEELAMGAIASGNVLVLNEEVIWQLNIPRAVIEETAERERRELERRERVYRGGMPPADVRAHTVIVVDDGLATGASMRAAVAGLQLQNPKRIVVAVPVAAPDTCASFKDLVDEVVCLETPEPFYGVGAWYEDFSQISDEEVQSLLQEARQFIKASGGR